MSWNITVVDSQVVLALSVEEQTANANRIAAQAAAAIAVASKDQSVSSAAASLASQVIATTKAAEASASATTASTQAGIAVAATSPVNILGTPLTGYTVGANFALAAEDTILVAFGKVQSQISNFSGGLSLSSPITGYVVGANTALAATDTILQAFAKAQGQINARVLGSGTINYLSKFTAAGTIGNSNLTDDGTLIASLLDFVVSSGKKFSVGVIPGLYNITASTAQLTTAIYCPQYGSINGDVQIITNGAGNKFIFKSNGNLLIGNTDGTDKIDVNGTARIRTRANSIGTFATYSATGVMQERTAAQSADDILKSISGYNAAVAQKLEHTAAGVINWVNI